MAASCGNPSNIEANMCANACIASIRCPWVFGWGWTASAFPVVLSSIMLALRYFLLDEVNVHRYGFTGMTEVFPNIERHRLSLTDVAFVFIPFQMDKPTDEEDVFTVFALDETPPRRGDESTYRSCFQADFLSNKKEPSAKQHVGH
jgi:hypothetical protein